MDEILLNKAAIIERCLQRISEEYQGNESDLETNHTKLDSIILNLLRACEASIDAAMHLVRIKKLGVPQQSRDAFKLLQENGVLDDELSAQMQAMIGFRTIAVHNYQKISLPILQSILEDHLTDFQDFARIMVQLDNQ
jgi:uncharacterized protein YutE (UPF0331/DUF86 family)